MRIKFAPLADVSVTHGYYAGGCEDVELVPTQRTIATLRAGRVILRAKGGTSRLFFEVEEGDGGPVSSLSGQTLCFGIRVLDSSFCNVTKAVIPQAELTPRYANATSATALDPPTGVTLAAANHTHIPALAQRPVTLTLRDASGRVADVRVLATDGHANYDFQKLPGGEYVLQEDYGGGTTRESRLVADSEVNAMGVWGVLMITVNESFYAAPPAFALTFEARTETLRYYVVADKWPAAEFSALQVADAGAAAEGRPPITFERLDSPLAAPFLSETLLGDDNARVAVFRSQGEVARRERGLQKLRLVRGATVIVEHLPFPGPERPSAELIVHLSKP